LSGQFRHQKVERVTARRQVFVNGRFLTRPATGVDRFARELLLALDKELGKTAEPAFDMVVLTPHAVEPPPFRCIQVRAAGRWSGHAWEQLSLPWLTLGAPLISLCNTGPVFKRRHLAVIHDATTVRAPESYSRSFRLLYGALMPLLGRIASTVVTVSNYAKRDIAQAFHIPEQRIQVIGEGGEHMLGFGRDEAILDKHGLRERPFLLAVSSLAPHKNFKLLIEAIGEGQQLDYDIVIAGGGNSKVFGQANLNQHPRVHFVGFVSNEELRTLYEHATAFVFPSLQEGFGLPLVEAMALGCPVIASNAASIPEVCGDAALYFDPHNAPELKAKMDRVVNDPILRQSLVEGAKQRSAHWTWPRAANSLSNMLIKV
jgi:glycosyltransferase involved in cell wall biosynthesis